MQCSIVAKTLEVQNLRTAHSPRNLTQGRGRLSFMTAPLLLANFANLQILIPADLLCQLRAACPDYSFTRGGKFFNSLATALFRFFSCLSGFAFGSIVLLATPRHTKV